MIVAGLAFKRQQPPRLLRPERRRSDGDFLPRPGHAADEVLPPVQTLKPRRFVRTELKHKQQHNKPQTHMKTSLKMTLGAVLWTAMLLQPSTLLAQGTAFTYQGRLDAGGAPANGSFDLRFAIYDAASGGSLLAGPLTNVATPVINGLFTVALDFGAGVFTGPARWLEIGVRTNGGGAFTALSPRQALTATPYAILAGNVSGVIANSSLPANPAFIGTVSATVFSGNGSGLTNLNASALTSGTVPTAALGNAWKISGNAGTTPGTHFVGTTDNQPLEFKVNGQRVLRLEPGTNAPSVVAGSAQNSINAGSEGATIGGGHQNSIQENAVYATIGGGVGNAIEPNAWYGTIAGGYSNTIRGDNLEDTSLATIGGGAQNTINSRAWGATIGGGSKNTIAPYASYATIPGGFANRAAALAFAAGYRAKADHPGAFVWGDFTEADIVSTNANSVTMRASGGYRLFSNSGATTGVALAAGGGSWTSISDRNAKENFASVDALAVLAKVVSLPITTWNYKSQDPAIRHIGPTAQDFKAAFGLGESDTGITSIDADGVALAAIQGLNQKVETRSRELEARSRKLEAENAALKAELKQIKQLLDSLASQLNGGAQ
jgi:hypothetical protein